MKKFVILLLCALAISSPVAPFSSAQSIFGVNTPVVAENVQDVLKCIAKASVEKGSDFTTGHILGCALERTEDADIGVNAENNFINFVVKAIGKNESFVTGNSHLEWGKWTQNNKDVANVNNLTISNTSAAMFRASGRKLSPSGCEGGFTILKKNVVIAKITFDVPSKGANALAIKHYGKHYACVAKGFSTSGSPTVTIKCGHASRIGETENDAEIILAHDRAAPKIVDAGKYYHIFVPKIDDYRESVNVPTFFDENQL